MRFLRETVTFTSRLVKLIELLNRISPSHALRNNEVKYEGQLFPPLSADPTFIPGLGGINAMLVTEVPTHPLTSQTERAWLGAKK